MNKIRAAIIEDEIPAARLLNKMLTELRPEWEILLLPGNVEGAVKWFNSNPHPDILFLDIQLTDGVSFSFIEQANPESMIVFTTAYDEYAIRAFKVNSIDYLLKPISFERFLKAVNKVHDLLLKETPPGAEEFLFVKSDKQMKKIFLKDILFIEGLENYICIYTASDKTLVHSTMKNIYSSLPESDFIQTHRSFIVNIHHVSLIEGNILNIAGHEIPVARNYRETVFARIIKNPL